MELAEILECGPPDFAFSPRYNVAPTQLAPVAINDGGRRKLRLMRWGLVPSWAKDPAIGNQMINARAETLTQKSSYRKPFEKQRCLIPSTGFFEWQEVAGTRSKIPMRIFLKDQKAFALAGLYDRWKQPDGNELHSFTIITTLANELVRPIHARMPVVLHKRDYNAWLDPEFKDTSKLSPLLVPYSSELMQAYEISTVVNSPKNDIPECVRPSSEVKQGHA